MPWCRPHRSASVLLCHQRVVPSWCAAPLIGNQAIAAMREAGAIDWITALKSASIRTLVEQGQLQLGLFDQRHLLELSCPDYPGERLIACRNPELAKLRAHKREELLGATEHNLAKIQARVDAGKLAGRADIGLRVGRLIDHYKVAKHLALTIEARALRFERKSEAIAAEAALMTVRRCTVSRPYSLNCPPSRATPAARLAPEPMFPPWTCSPPPTQNSSVPSY